MSLLLFLLAGFGVTTIITKGDIFEPLRSSLDNNKEGLYENFFGILITCPMCVGFWVGIFQSIMFGSIMSSAFSVNYLYQEVFATIFDGAMLGGVAWSIHQILNVLSSKFSYYATKALYYEFKIIEDEKEKLDKSTKKEVSKEVIYG